MSAMKKVLMITVALLSALALSGQERRDVRATGDSVNTH